MITGVFIYTAWLHSLLSGEIVWGRTELTAMCVSLNLDTVAPVTYLYGSAAPTNYNKHTMPASSMYVRYNETSNRVELCVSSIPVSYRVPISGGISVSVGQLMATELNGITFRPICRVLMDFTSSPLAANEMIHITPDNDVLAYYTGSI